MFKYVQKSSKKFKKVQKDQSSGQCDQRDQDSAPFKDILGFCYGHMDRQTDILEFLYKLLSGA